jgi:hypothetical protein
MRGPTVPTQPPKSGTDFLRQLAGTAHNAKPRDPSCSLRDALRSEVEAWLNSFGVKWTGPVEISLDSIDVKESRGHQSRETPIVEDTVQGVVASINAGDYIKPIVTFIEHGRANIIDGNNRDEGHRRAQLKEIESYVIDSETPSAIVARMLVASNAHHPQRPDVAHRVKQCAFLVHAHGVPTEQAVRDANITREQLRNHLKVVEADKRAQTLKIKDFIGKDGLPETARRALHRITMDAAFHAAARTAIDTGMTSQEVERFSIDIRSHKSETEMLAYVEQVRQQRIEAERGRRAGSRLRNDPKANLSQGIGKIVAVDPVQLAQSVITDVDRRIVLDRIEEAVTHLARLEAGIALKKASTQ